MTLPSALKPAVDPATLTHKHLLDGDFWRRIPAYADVDVATFLDHRWQAKNTITRVDKLLAALLGLVPESYMRAAEAGFKRAPMNVRVSPYLLSLIDWNDPINDPLRIQFLPVASRLLGDHPQLLDGSGPVDVTRDSEHFFLLPAKPQREFPHCGGFACALQTRHQDHRRRLHREVEARALPPHQVGELAVHHPDQRLPGREAAHHFLA